MALKPERIKSICAALVTRDAERNTMFTEMDKMYHNDWDLPNGLPKWVRKNVSTDPHDALLTSVRVLSTVRPQITYYPIDTSNEGRQRANRVEDALQWHLELTNRRSPSPIIKDVIHSVLRYDEVAAQVIHKPTQEALAGKSGRDNWDRRGLFTIKVHNPHTVHAVRTDDNLEQVFLAKTMPILSVVSDWGDRAKFLKTAYEEDGFEYCLYFDFTNAEGRRLVWAVPVKTQDSDPETLGEGVVSSDSKYIFDGNTDLPFMSWVERYGNSALEEEPEYQRHPLLASVYQAGQWDNQNIVESTILSELIAHAASPRTKTKTNDGMAPNINYETPGSNVELQTNEEYDVVPPPPVDRFLQEAADRLSARISKSTVARVLQNLEFPTGTAYATINAVMQSATNSLVSYKELAQLALEDIFITELHWLAHKKENLIGYKPTSKADTTGYGEQINIEYDYIDPGNCVLKVKLTEFVPTDLLQKINAATLMHQQLSYPLERVYEDLGIQDGDVALKQWVREQLYMAWVGNASKSIAFQETFKEQQQMTMLQIEAQQMAQDAAMQAQAQQQGGQGMQPGMDQGGMSPDQAALLQQGAGAEQRQAFNRAAVGVEPGAQQDMLTAIFGGQGFNPAQGGTPPATGAPNVTRTSVNGPGG